MRTIATLFILLIAGTQVSASLHSQTKCLFFQVAYKQYSFHIDGGLTAEKALEIQQKFQGRKGIYTCSVDLASKTINMQIDERLDPKEMDKLVAPIVHRIMEENH